MVLGSEVEMGSVAGAHFVEGQQWSSSCERRTSRNIKKQKTKN